MIRKILLYVLLLFLPITFGCAQHGGGGDYYFEHYDPATGEITKASVHSVREFESAKVKFKDVEVDIQGVKPGPDNTGKALGIIDTLLKAGATMP
jgi:hypothetical protein